jgi:hypothetical protein
MTHFCYSLFIVYLLFTTNFIMVSFSFLYPFFFFGVILITVLSSYVSIFQSLVIYLIYGSFWRCPFSAHPESMNPFNLDKWPEQAQDKLLKYWLNCTMYEIVAFWINYAGSMEFHWNTICFSRTLLWSTELVRKKQQVLLPVSRKIFYPVGHLEQWTLWAHHLEPI